LFAGIRMFVRCFYRMKFLYKIPYIIVAGFAWVVIVSSCANQGMPTGGPRDTIPPVLTGTYPGYKSVNFRGNEVRLTFNEYIIPDQVSEQLVISPPLEKRPLILTKSRTLIVRFNESLQDSLTYSMDFKNSIVDNNERNALENLRFLFSTGDRLDSLRVAGKVVNAFNMEPLENTLVMLHRNLHDSAVYTLRPLYIARTDKEGMYLFDNVAEGQYNLFSLNDVNTNLRYDEGAEELAFHDSVIIPSAEYHVEADTLATGADSLLVAGHIHFYPGPVYLRQFTEDIYDQYLKTSRRDSPYQFTLVFNEPVRDTFNIRLVNQDIENWVISEPNLDFDSLTFWITDTTLARQERIMMEISYFQIDTANNLFVEKDTLDLQYVEKEDPRRRRRPARNEDEDAPAQVPQFSWVTNLSTTGFDLNKDIVLMAPQPLRFFNPDAVSVYLADDTLKSPLPVLLAPDSVEYRTYRISYNWDDETSYTLAIDSAASVNIYGLTSREILTSFKTRSMDYYGAINLAITGSEGQLIVQLLENKPEERVIREKIIDKDQTVVFDYLPPDKYRVKAIFDANRNGRWDPGSYQDKYQPETVIYINEVIKVRSNWDSNLPWEVKPDPSFVKNIRDREVEEQLRKEALEKQRREEELQRNEGQPLQNDMFSPGGSTPGTLQPMRR
jgi:hypothetical protein